MITFKQFISEAILHGPYEDDKGYRGIISEIKYLPVSAIERTEMDFRPEVMSVSDEVAKNMKYDKPVEVTAYHYDKANKNNTAKVTLTDGHHRTAAAIQTKKKWLPVEVSAQNCTGAKLNKLISLSKEIESEI